jgi:ribosome maturation factor RimP
MPSSRHERLRSLIAVPVEAAGFDLESVDVENAGKRRVVRVVVDSDHGVTLDAAADLSRLISDALDETEVMASSPYVLEVTSQGVDRPLTELRHWRRALNRLVEVTRVDGSKVQGRVADVQAGHVTLESANADTTEISFDEIARAVVQVEFSRTDAEDGE